MLAGHTADWHEESQALSCSCGDRARYVVHIAALLGTDEAGARQALLTAHDNVEVNAGICGGCDTCGSQSAGVHCPICGDADHPCLVYYEVGAGSSTDPNDTEGMK